ncbi:MAG: hypothetical protein N2235_05405 [Fischerella sp.]|nr:hypothetical protein [Fischerella sp.]
MARRKKERRFIAMWCSEGLESLIDITDKLDAANNFERYKIFDIIQNPDEVKTNQAMAELNRMLLGLTMRARANTQRHYEIYMVVTPNNITANDLTAMFNANPQGMVDLFREKGVKIHSDRATSKPLIV